MNYKLGFTAHHVRKEVYFQTEPKYLVIFQSEKQDDIMIKEYEKKKKKKICGPKILCFHKVISTEQTQENSKLTKIKNIYIYIFHLIGT